MDRAQEGGGIGLSNLGWILTLVPSSTGPDTACSVYCILLGIPNLGIAMGIAMYSINRSILVGTKRIILSLVCLKYTAGWKPRKSAWPLGLF